LKDLNLLTIDQLCRRLKLKKSYVYDLTYRKKIPFKRIGRFLRFDPKEIKEWIDAQTYGINREKTEVNK
jgi:excisionase family DNA binding protein